MQVTVTTLSSWTGLHRDTIRKRLAPLLTGTRGETVDSVEALPLIFGAGERLDPAQEKAKLDRAKREAAEIDLQLKRREVIRLTDCFKVIDVAAVNFRDHLLCLPGRFAAVFSGETDPREIERVMDEEIRQALTHLTDAKPRFENV